MTTTFVLVPGAGGDAWFWHRLVAELERRGHHAVPVELPAADDSAGLAAYADTVVAAIGDRSPVVLVAQSMGGLTAPLVCERVPVELLVLVNAMVPLPGETGGEWWTVTGQGEAAAGYRRSSACPRSSTTSGTYFHDVPADVVAAAQGAGVRAVRPAVRGPVAAGRAGPTSPPGSWPGATTGSSPLEFQRRVAAERLGLEVDEMPGGHLVALSRPVELADRLEAYLRSR